MQVTALSNCKYFFFYFQQLRVRNSQLEREVGRLKERVEEEEELKCQLHRRFVESKRQVMEEQVNKQVVAHMDTICVRNVCERALDQVK